MPAIIPVWDERLLKWPDGFSNRGLGRWEWRCQTVVGRIERKRFGAVFSSARVRRTINVQGKRDCGAFGPLLPDAESVSYVLSTRWSSSNPPFRTKNSFRINYLDARFWFRAIVVQRFSGARLGETLFAGHPSAVAVATSDSGAIGTEQEEPRFRPNCAASCYFTGRARDSQFRLQHFLPLSDVRTWRGLSGRRTRQDAAAEFQKIIDHSGIVWKLLDRSISPSGSSSR